jgi:hypothetical protein
VPLFLDKHCPDESQGNYFYAIRMRATGQLALCCEECESRFTAPDLDAAHQEALSPYFPLADDTWDYASWEDIDNARWDRRLFRYSTWANSDKR